MELARRLRGGVAPELLLVAFVLANLAAMHAWLSWEAIPFHFIFVSVTVVYGVRAWRTRTAVAAIVAVGASTAAVIAEAVHHGVQDLAELAEVPLMSLIFVVMVLHVQRRRDAAERASSRAARQGEQLERERRFFADASHELLTPITIGRGHLEVLRREELTEGRVQETCTVVLDELSRLQELVCDLLLIARLDARVVEVGRLDVDRFVDQVGARWASLPDRRWTVEAATGAELDADPEHLRHALDNLLENAHRHTSSGDPIVLRAVADAAEVRFVVEDGGEGIPAGELERIFDRFHRIPDAGARGRGGAGLGLAIVSAVADAHGGSIEIGSAPGEGTRATLALPRCAPSGRAVAALPEVRRGALTGR
jgi:signal transduction histidine kinase